MKRKKSLKRQRNLRAIFLQRSSSKKQKSSSRKSNNIRVLTLISFILLPLFLSAEPDQRPDNLILRDVLYLQNGEEVAGRLEKISNRKVVFQVTDGQIEFAREDVLSIDVQKRRTGDYWQTVSDIEDKVLLESIANLPDLDKYPNAGYISLLTSYTIQYYSDKHIEYHERQIGYILEERGKTRSRKSFKYFSDNQTSDVDFARTISPDSMVFHLDDAALEYGQPYGKIPEYDRLIKAKFAMGEIHPGSILDYQLSKNYGVIGLDNPFSKTIIFGDFEPIEKIQLKCLVHNDRLEEFHRILIGEVDQLTLNQISDSLTEFSIEIENIPMTTKEDFMPPLHEILPYAIISFGDDYETIAYKYREAISDEKILHENKELNDQIELMISAANADQLRTAKYIYKLVIDKIQLKGPDFKDYSILPTAPTDVWKRGFGNNLDINFLLYSLMLNAGLDVEWGFLCSRYIPYSRKIPTIESFYAPAVLMHNNDEMIVLSIDGEYRPFGSFNTDCSGEYFWSTDNGKFIEHGQYPDWTINTRIKGKIDTSGSLQISSIDSFKNIASIAPAELKQKNPAELERYVSGIIADYHPASELIDFSIKGLDDILEDIVIEINYKINGYATATGDKLIFKLPQADHIDWGGSGQSKVYPIFFDEIENRTIDMEIIIPNDFEKHSLINNIDFENNALEFKVNMAIDDSVLKYSEMESIKSLSLQASEWKNYQEFITSKRSIDGQYIILKRK